MSVYFILQYLNTEVRHKMNIIERYGCVSQDGRGEIFVFHRKISNSTSTKFILYEYLFFFFFLHSFIQIKVDFHIHYF